MKSFADWTDEIRALMNPPKPMIDTCNLAALEGYEEGTFVPTLKGAWFDVAAQGLDSQEFYFARIGNKVTVGKRVKSTALERGTAIHDALANEESLMPWQREMLERAAAEDDVERFYNGAQWSPDEVAMLEVGRAIHEAVMERVRVPVLARYHRDAERWAKRQGIARRNLHYISGHKSLCSLPRGSKVFALTGWCVGRSRQHIDEETALIKVREMQLIMVDA